MVRAYGRRALAALAAVWLVAFGVLASRHEGRVAHVVDASGAVVHAGPGACHDHNPYSHVDGAPDSGDHDVCDVLTVLHQAAAPSLWRPQIAAPTTTFVEQSHHTTAALIVASDLFRLAPKTSPPSRA